MIIILSDWFTFITFSMWSYLFKIQLNSDKGAIKVYLPYLTVKSILLRPNLQRNAK